MDMYNGMVIGRASVLNGSEIWKLNAVLGIKVYFF